MLKFRNHILNSVKLCRNIRLKSYSPKSDLNNPSKFLLGCGTLGLTLGIIYYDFNKQKIYCKDAKNDELNIIDQPIQAPITAKPLDINQKTFVSLNEAIEQSKILIERFKIENGLPGIVVGVSINGKNVWSDGFGLSDLENNVACHEGTVMRIASISKSLTMVAAAKLWEEGKLDWDKSILSYLPNYPQPKFNDQAVTITPGQLASHLGGIRHYEKTLPDPTKPKPDKNSNEFDEKEYYIKDHYENVADSLKLFQNDPLLVNPGNEYLYTTHGYTLLSAIIETVAKEPFHIHMLKLFRTLGLEKTVLDRNDPLIYNRSRYYQFKNGALLNTAYVDNSYKWAGGGFLSTVGDLLKFGNIMLYSAQHDNSIDRLPGFLKSATVAKLWEPVVEIKKGSEFKYGMGWLVVTQQQEYGLCRLRRFFAAHSGGAIGASSFLLILPKICLDNNDKVQTNSQWDTLPQGVIVAVLTNLQEISCSKLAIDIAQLFDKVDVKN